MKNNDNNNDHNKHRLKMLDLNEAPSSLWEETSTENNYEVLNDHGHGHGHDLGDGDDDWIRFKIAIINKKIAEKRKENEALKASIDEVISTNQDLQTEIADEERRREQSLVSRESNFVSVETDTSISNNKRVATIPASVEAGECSTAREMPMKKGRVVVRTRTEENTMSDGCQWRKYGQKESKTNPNPRAYYRCGMGVNCPVRKQVQRCAEDKSILITTYEQKHNHKLPSLGIPIANVMSCVAEMSTTQSNVLPGLSGLSIFSQPTLLPGFPGLATISASPPFPTVILDLTIPQLQINNSPNGLDMVGLTQQLLGQTRSNEPNRENGNLLNDPTNTARALVASNPSSGPDRENGFAFE